MNPITMIADKILNGITALLEYMLGIMMIALVGLTFMQVILRYVFNNPTSWSSELSRFILIWLTFTGASVITKYGTHLSMGLNIDKFLRGIWSKIIRVFVNILIMTTLMIIAYYSWKVTMISGARIAPMTKIPMYYPWLALPVNSVLMTMYFLADTVKQITKHEERIPQ
ncbi:MAG: TRAP transporter small permease [Desulfobacula sp.]|jgi:TRAP-type C4-dicarboxylate transport system permease small subunit|nr:TRAP transporter small permease [Desulfobacula sp.]